MSEAKKEYSCGDFGFEVNFEQIDHIQVSGVVNKITARSSENEIMETEKYLTFRIKWDTCSHFNFGDEGYLHLCGAASFKNHVELIRFIYRRAFELMGQKPMAEEDWL